MEGSWVGEGQMLLDEGKRKVDYLEESTIICIKPPVVY